MIAFSTCWNSHRHSDGAEMAREILDLGFDHIELGSEICHSLLTGIRKMREADRIRICSVRAAPSASAEANPPNVCQFASDSAEDRERAMRQTAQAIDLAARLGASFVILELGRVKMQPITEPLIQMAKAGKHLSRAYVRAKLEAVQERERIAPRPLQRVKDCLRRVMEHAAGKNMRLGIENRRGYEEIPSERELSALLAEFSSPEVGYWHNFAYCQVKENLAFLDHAEWLRATGPRALGCHVQDCKWPARDHEPPFTGGVDFEKLVPLLPAHCLFVWEMNPQRSATEIRRSVEIWRERFGE